METLSLTVNGEEVASLIEPGTTLQKFLHDTLRATDISRDKIFMGKKTRGGP